MRSLTCTPHVGCEQCNQEANSKNSVCIPIPLSIDFLPIKGHEAMKRRLMPALSIGIVVILIGSLAYAADRKKNAKAIVDRNTDQIHEEEAITAELLNAVENKEQRPINTGDKGKVDSDRSADKKGQLKSKK
jgi:hypothetical protein